ncbi:MOSC domain-containing protein [Listeria costaricensis]|uniref:MOSC domain-containing protein n=1 Tax=Listeria costaricensis TaxID=2026604 RepID=UPI000C070A27|nr:MOSC domain-containing protein [Listeria costaricensis]
MKRQIEHVAIGMPKEMAFGEGKSMMTGIEKRAVEEAYLTQDGFLNDQPYNKKYHGGPDRAVCLYPLEHYAFFEQIFQKKLPKSAFGENLIVSGMLEKDVAIGDIFQAGQAVFQVTEARNPCSTIAKYHHMPELYKKVTETSFTGYLARTIQEGEIHRGDQVTLLEKGKDPDVTVAYCHEMILHGKGRKQELSRILAVEELSVRYRLHVEKKLTRYL